MLNTMARFLEEMGIFMTITNSCSLHIKCKVNDSTRGEREYMLCYSKCDSHYGAVIKKININSLGHLLL